MSIIDLILQIIIAILISIILIPIIIIPLLIVILASHATFAASTTAIATSLLVTIASTFLIATTHVPRWLAIGLVARVATRAAHVRWLLLHAVMLVAHKATLEHHWIERLVVVLLLLLHIIVGLRVVAWHLALRIHISIRVHILGWETLLAPHRIGWIILLLLRVRFLILTS